MARSIADIIAEHEAAQAAADGYAARNGLNVKFRNPKWEAEGLGFPEYGELCAAEDELMFELCEASCASDDEFLAKVAHLLKANPGFLRVALADVLERHMKHRETFRR
jgi:hypothetical protein